MAKTYKYGGYPGNQCKHPDCFYRKTLGSTIPFCSYALDTGQLRKTPANECDKYINRKEMNELMKKEGKANVSVEYYIEQHYGKPVDEVLYDLYVVQDMTMKEVADEMHMGVGTIHSWLHKYHISKNDNLW